MGSNRETKRAELRERLIEAAEIELRDKGLAGLKARDVTARAGCALGALYNAVEDLDMLVLEVNARTLAKMGTALRASLPGPDAQPVESLQALAEAYIDFALENRRIWLALFEHRLPEERTVPEEHRQSHSVLIDGIAAPLARLRPDLSPEALALRARTVFAAVHGVVHLSLQGQFVGVPLQDLKSEVRALVEIMARRAG
ncbi:TetR/AcrR family transcriptional regulator [Roseibium suaedae]|uniref:DNA-binding transcriptional regulator, AcrR family n=1 Tax=Roseibium suaedae TaxID=735517 RepID=A0A1M7GFD0_9HYPH|nr:TetR/AcrR family transcriptional regulator [Roseibium suaedae]SHM14828.1 DNA-binding transcriptional regulator, AcrR family [Roseibium suaedae]